jgi:predicted ATPase
VACFLKSIGLKNILSFRDAKLPLESLNVLIGPNAAGKSNLIDVIGLLQAAPGDLNAAILRGGGAACGSSPVRDGPKQSTTFRTTSSRIRWPGTSC